MPATPDPQLVALAVLLAVGMVLNGWRSRHDRTVARQSQRGQDSDPGWR